jgi:CBS domain containing-hemolysin-like protein
MENVLLWLLVIGLCLALTFLFSGMEAGVLALNRLHIRQKMRAGEQSAKVLLGYLENPEDFLWTILVGNTVTNFLAVGLVVAELYYWLSEQAGLLWAVFLVFVFLLYAVGDLLPKMLFQRFPNRLCLALARPFRFVHLGLSPLVACMTWFSRHMLRWTGGQAFTGRLFGDREEMRLVMQESAQEFTSEERQMINRVLDLQNLTVRHISVPMAKVVTVTARTPMAAALSLARDRGLSRLLVEHTVDGRARIMGLVSLMNVLYRADLDPNKTVGDYVKPALFVDEDLHLEGALRRMQRSGQRLAIVLARDRRELGVVSLQDILKAIFGEVSL